jgi:hypothetical protein
VEVLADDYTSKGDEDMLEVKIGDDLIFLEKKFVKILTDEIDPAITDKVEAIEEDDDDEDDDDFNLDLGDLKDDDEEDTFSFDMEDVEDDDDDDDDDSEEIVAQVEEPIEEPIETPTPPAEEPVEPQQPMNKDNEMTVLQAKLKKSLAELEDLRNDMRNTFTSSDTLGNTITSLRGMLDALKKDQMDMLSKGQ